MQKKRFLISTVTAAAAIVVLSVVLAVSWLTYGLSSPDAAGRIDTSSTAAEEKDIQTMLQIQPLGVVPSSGVKGFYLSASDLIQKENASGEEISTRAETIAATATSYGFNAVILETVLGGTVLYASETAPSYPVDAVSLVQAAVKEKGLELYLVFQPGLLPETAKPEPEEEIRHLVQQYQPDGILLADYYAAIDSKSYAEYMETGGGSAYEEWLRSSVSDQVDGLVAAVRECSADIPVGITADPVWRSAASDQNGIQTKTEFEAYDDGFADVRQMALDHAVDFICLRNGQATGNTQLSFSAVLDWWNALAKESGMPLYLIHAGEKACTKEEGWNGTDQLARQLSLSLKASAYCGSFFSGYDRMASDPQGSTTALLKLLDNEYKEENLFTDLTISSPDKSTVTTYENTVVFSGKYDPQFDVTINGQKIIPTKEGEFYEKYQLDIGVNKFKVEHKGQVKEYSVNRKVQVFQSVSPSGTLEVDGGVEIQVAAMAYRGAKVTATFNGKTITLTETDGDEDSRDSAYTRFTGKFTAPAAGDKDKKIGTIVFKASYSSSSETKNGAVVTVLKKLTVPDWTPDSGGDGTTELEPLNPKLQAIVNTPYVEVYDPATIVTYPCPIYYSLPQGTVDYIDYQRTMTFDGKTATYYYLHSGKRVAVSDVTVIQNGTYHGNNAISDLLIADEGNQTVLKVKQKWNAPFNISFGDLDFYTGGADSDFWVRDFTSNTVTITFDYATQVEQVTKELLKNTTMFTDIRWEKVIEYNVSRYRLHLQLSKAGRYYGCYSEYDADGYLVLRFNHLPGSLKGVRIFLDPGHGGVDPGAIGKYTENGSSVILYEKDANLGMVKKLAQKLQAEGAVVSYLTEEERAEYRGSSLADRYKAAQKFKAEIFISVHCNSTTSSGPKGTSAYYTTPYSMPLAREISKAIAAEAGLNDRGANCNYFAVNRGRTFPSVLVETAFISNPDEVKLLASEQGQDKIATGILKGIQNYLKLNA